MPALTKKMMEDCFKTIENMKPCPHRHHPYLIEWFKKYERLSKSLLLEDMIEVKKMDDIYWKARLQAHNLNLL